MEKLRLGIGWRVTYLQSIVGSTEKDKKMFREMPLIFPTPSLLDSFVFWLFA